MYTMYTYNLIINSTLLLGFWFDGKKNVVKIWDKEAKRARKVERNHYTVVVSISYLIVQGMLYNFSLGSIWQYLFQNQDGQQYLGFFVHVGSGAESLADELLDHFEAMGISLENLEVVGMDGCKENTGFEVGRQNMYMCRSRYNVLM